MVLKVELVYVAKGGNTLQRTLEVKQGSTVGEVLLASDLYSLYPETKGYPVGIYAKQVSLATVVQHEDRIEVYRPLVRDPKEKRRQLARLRT